MFAFEQSISTNEMSRLQLRYRSCHGLIISFVGIFAIGCSDSDPMSVERASVSGTVTLDGQPLQAGAIVFQSDRQLPDGDSVTAFGFIENGAYRIDLDDGPAVGSARVEFRPKPLQREELEDVVDQAAKSQSRRSLQMEIVKIPEKYGEASTLLVEMSPGQNRHDFQLESGR